MAALAVAALGTAAKQVTVAAARREALHLLGTFWKVFAVIAAMTLLTPVGLVIVAYVALARSITGGVPVVDAQSQAPALHSQLDCPVPGAVVTQGFGPTSVDVEPPGFGYPHFHSGVDLAAPTGTSVYAASAGFVEVAGTEVDAVGIPIGYGNYVELGNGEGQEQIYGHLSSIAVAPNQVLSAGAIVGQVGSSGNSTGPHLHFEVRLHGRAVNPSTVLRC